ncbi:MAG: hemerythrin domain-containing protein [Thermoguttaceae bacterium]|jgi:hemerythrin-like domain-containing protein
MALKSKHTRRDFILAGTATGGGLLLAGYAPTAMGAQIPLQKSEKEKAKAGEDISPAEDLMREHGLFERILLIYEESGRRLKNKTEFDLGTLAGTAKIVRSFIEDYHSKLEEDQVFPRFEKAGKLVKLVKLLREQHQAGRKLTDQILQSAVPDKTIDEEKSQNLLKALRQFIRMYRPHLAREDTVVFPAMHAIIAPEDYDVMGDKFEDLEHKLFGEHGFENVVGQVAELEKTLEIYELSKFTAKV